MHHFEVWAPRATEIQVKIRGHLYPMARLSHGWWAVDVQNAGTGDDYGFVIGSDDNALPDPRSPWQPNGVHGLSRIVDHSTFQWHDDQWQAPSLESAILYEMHIGTFTNEGTFDAAAQKLNYLRELGVTHVELMPVNEFSGSRGWGYDGVDLYAPHQSYGGPDGLKRFVDACHRHGLAAILDVVYNHLGPVGNYLSRFGDYFSHQYTTPWGPAVNLDGPGSQEVRRFFCDNALMWLRDYHFDGLRLDAVHAFLDRSAIHFLEQLAMEVRELGRSLGRKLILIAESDLNNPRVVGPLETGGLGMDAQWSDDFHHALHAVLSGERTGYYADFGSMADLAKALSRVFVYDGCYSEHRARRHGRPVEGLPAHRFIAALQNHDQIGNRAQGDRLHHLVSPGRARVGAGLLLLAPFVPLLFQGEEFAASSPFQYFTNHDDPQVGVAVSEGRRGEFAAFGWNPEEVPDPQREATFQRSKLHWEEINEESHAAMLRWYKELIHLRKSTPDLMNGDLQSLQIESSEQLPWLIMHRGRMTVACNLAKESLSLPVPAQAELVLASESGMEAERGTVRLPPDSIAILRIA